MLTETAVIRLRPGVKIRLRATGKQQASSGWPGWRVLRYRALMTTTRIGPVLGPTATRTLVTTPRPTGGASVMLRLGNTASSAGVGMWIQMQDVAGPPK